jgi:hypothetical protein
MFFSPVFFTFLFYLFCPSSFPCQGADYDLTTKSPLGPAAYFAPLLLFLHTMFKDALLLFGTLFILQAAAQNITDLPECGVWLALVPFLS